MAPSLGELDVDHPALPPRSRSIEDAIHVERRRQDRDPDHALPHPGQAAASRDSSPRGKGIASPDQPKQLWRPQGPKGLDVRDYDRALSLLNPDSEQVGSRSCVGRDRIDGRRDLDQVAAARLGRSGHLIAAAISAAPFRSSKAAPDKRGRPLLLTQAKRDPRTCLSHGAGSPRTDARRVLVLP